MSKDIFIKSFIQHARIVQDYMIFLEKNLDKLPFKVDEFALLRRCMYHDLTKLEDGFVLGFVRIAEYKEAKRLGLSTNNIDKTDLYKVSEKYYPLEPHHIEYHIKNGTKPSNVDICEMCCDILAHSHRDGRQEPTQELMDELVPKYNFFRDNQAIFTQIIELLQQSESLSQQAKINKHETTH